MCTGEPAELAALVFLLICFSKTALLLSLLVPNTSLQPTLSQPKSAEHDLHHHDFSLGCVFGIYIIRLVKSGKFLDPVSRDFIFRAPALGCPFGSSVA